ncbi:EF-hand calcium-binding domain-containing protein 11-like [Clytia hemisphaerica]|uniref:EF-hand calcium-binding domain-containing protein 11-like n=1 Tax=Clytia hemisphaerica TaxID=252671 RepID=UPI0034D458C1|eukprot:TCONS_00017483-protein
MMDEHFIRSFSFADKENLGYLNRHQLKIFYICLFGHKPSPFELETLFNKSGKIDGKTIPEQKPNNLLSKQELWNHIESQRQYKDKYEEMREIFQAFDLRGKGFINFEDFKEGMKVKYKNMDEINMQKYFRELDSNCDDRVSFHDFVLMMQDGKSIFENL